MCVLISGIVEKVWRIFKDTSLLLCLLSEELSRERIGMSGKCALVLQQVCVVLRVQTVYHVFVSMYLALVLLSGMG